MNRGQKEWESDPCSQWAHTALSTHPPPQFFYTWTSFPRLFEKLKIKCRHKVPCNWQRQQKKGGGETTRKSEFKLWSPEVSGTRPAKYIWPLCTRLCECARNVNSSVPCTGPVYPQIQNRISPYGL